LEHIKWIQGLEKQIKGQKEYEVYIYTRKQKVKLIYVLLKYGRLVWTKMDQSDWLSERTESCILDQLSGPNDFSAITINILLTNLFGPDRRIMVLYFF
jgi:hypothetical protein